MVINVLWIDDITPIKVGDILKLLYKNTKYAQFTCYVIFVIINMIIKLNRYFNVLIYKCLK